MKLFIFIILSVAMTCIVHPANAKALNSKATKTNAAANASGLLATSPNDPQIIAVQTRPQPLTNEISIHGSYLPTDHFNHYLVAGFSYTHYFNDYLGWEVLNYNATKQISTNLERDLLGQYGALPEVSDRLIKYGTTNIVYSPLFMKNLFMRDKVRWGDLCFIAGYGLTQLAKNGDVNTLDFGTAIRFFGDTGFIYRIDFRQLVFLSNRVEPNLAISLGISYNLGAF